LGLEPAFARNSVAWPPVGPGALPLEPGDPDFPIPLGALRAPGADEVETAGLAGASAELTPATEPLATPAGRIAGRSPALSRALSISILFHVAVAMAMLSIWDNGIRIEGADQAGMQMAGNSDTTEVAGNKTEFPDAMEITFVPIVTPKGVEAVEAQPVPVTETIAAVEEPAEAAVPETLQPVTDARSLPVAPSEAAQAAPDHVATAVPPQAIDPVPEPSPQTSVPDPMPDVLTAESIEPDDNAVSQPVAPVAQAKPVETEQEVTAQVEPEPEPTPARKVEPQPAPKPTPKAKPRERKASKPEATTARKAEEKPKERARPEGKADGKVVKEKTAGKQGNSLINALRGNAEGKSKSSALASTGGGSGVGNAAVSNYPGKVTAKIRRVAQRTVSNARTGGIARIQFTVGANGDISGLRIIQSTGSPELDERLLAVVQRASPVPPIPPEANRKTWLFNVPIGIAR